MKLTTEEVQYLYDYWRYRAIARDLQQEMPVTNLAEGGHYFNLLKEFGRRGEKAESWLRDKLLPRSSSDYEQEEASVKWPSKVRRLWKQLQEAGSGGGSDGRIQSSSSTKV